MGEANKSNLTASQFRPFYLVVIGCGSDKKSRLPQPVFLIVLVIGEISFKPRVWVEKLSRFVEPPRYGPVHHANSNWLPPRLLRHWLPPTRGDLL